MPYYFRNDQQYQKMLRSIIPRLDKTQYGGKHNKCVIFPINATIVAETFERINHNWFVHGEVEIDLVIQVGDSIFHLHKLPIVSRSGYINRLVFQRSNERRDTNMISIQIENLPGGATSFELVVKFCYGWEVDLTASNIAQLYCAAHFLEMSDDIEKGNLISKTETFLSFLIFSSWNDTFQILKSCENFHSWTKDLEIVKRCTKSIAWKACTNSFGKNNPSNNSKLLNWWFEDISSHLRIDHFVDVIQAMKSKGMKPNLVGSCIAHWTSKWLSKITFGNDTTKNLMTYQFQRVTIECLIKLIPKEDNSVTCNFLLHLLKVGLAMKMNCELLNVLERRIAYMLEQCRVVDLLVKNFGNNDTIYDVGIIIRVVKYYVSFILSSKHTTKVLIVGRLVDGYLTVIASDERLKVQLFQSLAEALPIDSRFCDDNLYKATDMYLKAHPCLTEEERSSVCRFLEYHRLSQEVREHVVKNHRLPLKITTQFILLEQVNMTRSITAKGCNYQRTKAQAIVKVTRSLKKRNAKSNTELKQMTIEVEKIKTELNDLQMCKMKLQRQLKRSII